MKKFVRICSIGALHATVYLWLLPRLILPRFGHLGSKITVGVLIAISLVVLSTAFKSKQ